MTQELNHARCARCGALVDEAPNASAEHRIPCPSCGSTARHIEVKAEDTLEIHDSVAHKVKRGGRGKPVLEGKAGDDFWRKGGKWMRREMTIDREHHHYTESIIDPKTGEVLLLATNPSASTTATVQPG